MKYDISLSARFKRWLRQTVWDDSDLPAWITIKRFDGDKSKGYWRVVKTEYFDPGNCNVYMIATNADGSPSWGHQAIQRNGGAAGLGFRIDDHGDAVASFNMTGDSSFDPNRGEVGPYSIEMFGQSDVVKGIGLPLRQHVQLIVTVQWTVGGVVDPEPDPEPTGDYVTRAEYDAFRQRMIEALR